jgi:nitroreductase
MRAIYNSTNHPENCIYFNRQELALDRVKIEESNLKTQKAMEEIENLNKKNKEIVAEIFKHVKWAAYISPQGTPALNERPAAFIAVLVDTTIKTAGYELDIGAACQNIFLTAAEEGIGTCWMGAIDRNSIKEVLNIPETYVLNTVIALGYAAESPVFEDENGSIKYYKDENGILHVPKRKLEDVILEIRE